MITTQGAGGVNFFRAASPGSNGLNLLGNDRRAHELQQFILSSRPIIEYALMHLWRPMRITVFLLALACNRYKREICLTTTE